MIETTDTYQQSGVGMCSKIDVDNFIKLTEQVFANDPANLEFELRQERIAPYLVDVTKPLPEVTPLISIGGLTPRVSESNSGRTPKVQMSGM